MNKAAFLDRDGVINKSAPEGEYITRWEEMHILPGVAEAVVLLNGAGFRVIVVSNQRCVAKGLVTAEEVDALHQRMRDALRGNRANIDAIYYCPHGFHPACDCRKPQPGMLLEAAREHDIDLTKSWMVGDSDIDIEAGQRAGCNTARLLQNGDKAYFPATITSTSLLDVVHLVLEKSR